MTDQTAQNIQATIDSNPVVLFMKGSKKMPQCGFSSAVVNALSYLCLLYTSPSPRDYPGSRMPSSA